MLAFHPVRAVRGPWPGSQKRTVGCRANLSHSNYLGRCQKRTGNPRAASGQNTKPDETSDRPSLLRDSTLDGVMVRH